MYEDAESCARAVRAKDSRFDGWFFAAVTTTGVYCRPSCPVTPPKPENMRFFPTAAAAQAAGFRACRRCRPDASPGSPEWNARADLTARALRLIADGVVDRFGVPGLAARLGYSVRHVQRQLLASVGAGPVALARAQRAQTARLLIETSAVPLTDVAFAAGFSSVRTFNDTVRAVYGRTPSELREASAPSSGTLAVRLAFRRPFSISVFDRLVLEALPGVEEWRDGAFRRTLRLPFGHGIVSLRPLPDHVSCTLTLSDLRDLSVAIARCRWLLDLDADPVAVDALLSEDPVLRPLVAAGPGRRIPRTVDPEEFALRTVCRAEFAARPGPNRVVVAHGTPIEDPEGGLTHLFPDAVTLAKHDIGGELARALADGGLDLAIGSDWDKARAGLTSLGLDAGTVETIAGRALGDPDASVVGQAQWRPWRAYAEAYLRQT